MALFYESNEKTRIPAFEAFVGYENTVIPSEIPDTLEECSWELINILTKNGKLGDYFSVGDTKEITLTTGETLTMQLASINDGTGAAGQYYPNSTADFVSVEIMESTHVMNTQATNVGGWNGCEMRTYLNETVYPTLPNDLKSVIIEKIHMRTAGNKSTSLISASDKLWLPTHYEIFGYYTSDVAEDADHNIRYPIFPNSASRVKRKKTDLTGARYWWSSSPGVSKSTYFATVHSDGGYYVNDANRSHGVVIGLRIGHESHESKLLNYDELIKGINKTKFDLNNVAPVETGNTASQTYNVGDLLVFNGILQNVTQAIAQGTNIQIGANIENTTVEKEILKAKTKLLFSVPYDYSSIANARVAYNAIGKYIRDNGLNTYDNFHHFILIGRNSSTGVADSFFIPVSHSASKNKIGTINFYKFQFNLTSSTFLHLRDVSVDVTGGNTAHFHGMNFSISNNSISVTQTTNDAMGSVVQYFDTLELHWTDSFVGL